MFHRITACALLLTAFATAETFEDHQTKTFDFKPGQALRFEAEFGHLDVKSGDVNRVTLEAYRRVENATKEQAQQIFNDLGIDSKPDANGLSIATYFKTGWEPEDSGWGHHRNCMSSNRLRSHPDDDRTYCLKYADQLREVRYTLTVPRKVNLNVETRAGHMTIADIDGPVTATTAGGHITAAHIGGVAKIQTAGGHIKVDDSTGPATLKTAGGHITIGDVGGDLIAETAGGHITTGHVHGTVKAKTAGGHIEIKQADGAIEAKTVGGSIQARIGAQPKDPSYLETAAGSVTLEIANNVKLDVDAESRGGGVYSDFPLQSDVASTDEPNWSRTRSLHGKLNGGGPKVEVHTTHGRISLTKATYQY
jgi:hypothetical protein